MITITLKDGSKKKYEKNITVIDVAKDISEGFARNVISASFNGTTVDYWADYDNDGLLIDRINKNAMVMNVKTVTNNFCVTLKMTTVEKLHHKYNLMLKEL